MTVAEANLILQVFPINRECDYCDNEAVRKMVIEPFESKKDDDPHRDVVDVCERHKYIGNLHNALPWSIA